jgi:hypothetical protein
MSSEMYCTRLMLLRAFISSSSNFGKTRPYSYNRPRNFRFNRHHKGVLKHLLRDKEIYGQKYEPTASIRQIEEDMEKLVLDSLESKDGMEFTSFAEVKKLLDLPTEHRVSNLFDLFTVIAHWVALIDRAPVIKVTKEGEKFVEWEPLEEAKKRTEAHLAGIYFSERIKDRLSEEELKAEIKGGPSGLIRKIWEKEKI